MGVFTFRCLFGLLATLFFLQGSDSACPASWMNFQYQCYGVVAMKRPWMEAEVECQTLGQYAHLASILSEAEHAAVANYLKNSFPDVDSLWIGLSDPRRTRMWTWSDGSPFFYEAWGAGEPNNSGGREFCVSMAKASGFKEWADHHCKEQKASLCKSKL